MMRFILDCLRPGRARAAASARDSVELHAQKEEALDDNEMKELKNEVDMEKETLQRVKDLCCDTQVTVDSLDQRKTELKEQLKVIQDFQKQESETLVSLKDEESELKQIILQFETELSRASRELLHLQEEVTCAKEHVRQMHGQFDPLQESARESLAEIEQVKKKLCDLIAELISDEGSLTKMSKDPASVAVDQDSVQKVDVVASECDHMIKQETLEMEHVKQENTVKQLDKMQSSMENLKSSGSSSFTEITLTEVKEEDVMFRSATPKSGSSDLEEEYFEIVQPNQATNREFDFFHPNPFTDSDVFGDDYYPEVDVAECLPKDPFKDTDPFASDTHFVDIPEKMRLHDSFNPAESCLSEAIHYPLQSVDKNKDYGTPVNISLGDDFKQSTVKVSVPTEIRSPKPLSDTYPLSEEGFNNERCILQDADESGSSHSSALDNSFDGDCRAFSQAEEEDKLEVMAGSSFIRRVESLSGLQRIISGSYTGFPLSPCDTEPFQGFSDAKTFEHEYVTTSEHNNVGDKDCCQSKFENDKTFSTDLGHSCGQLQFEELNKRNSICSSTSSALDTYDYRYGDMFFFTVRLDPGSPELHNSSPVCIESNDIMKSESLGQMLWKDNHLSPEFTADTDDFESCGPKSEKVKQHSLIFYNQKGFDKMELETKTNNPASKHYKMYERGDSEDGDQNNPCFEECEDPKAFHSMLNSKSNNKSKVGLAVLDTESNKPESTVENHFSPLISNTEALALDYEELCTCDQVSPKSRSPQQEELYCSESLVIQKLKLSVAELQYFDPVSVKPIQPSDCVPTFEEMHIDDSLSHISERLDSGYHEVSSPIPFSLEYTDTKICNTDPEQKGSRNQSTLGHDNSEFHMFNPFSPESADTEIFSSEIENCKSGYMISKFQDSACSQNSCEPFSPQPSYTDFSNYDKNFSSSEFDMMSSHLSETEYDYCYPFSPFPNNKERCDEENVIPGFIQDSSTSNVETKPGSLVSNASHFSRVLHCDSVWRKGDLNQPSECSITNPDVFDTECLIVSRDTSTVLESCVHSFIPNISQQGEEDKNSTVNVTKTVDLNEIDYFCSELSKMVSSRSSDSVQQSVAEMLFGSDPNTCSFYPWDFEKQQNSC